MSTAWIVSTVLAWIVITLLTTAMIRVLRLIGALQAQLGGADPGIGTVSLYDEVDGYDEPTLIVVHEPGCAGCAAIPPALDALAAEGAPVRLLDIPDPAALPGSLRPASVPAAIGVKAGVVVALGRPRSVAALREAADATASADIAALPGAHRRTAWGVCAPATWTPRTAEGSARGTW